LPEAIQNTVNCQRCSLEVKLGKSGAAEYPVLPDFTPKKFLRPRRQARLASTSATIDCECGAPGLRVIPKWSTSNALQAELDVFSDGFCGFFLSVADFIRWQKKRYSVGPDVVPVRGSLVCVCDQDY